MTTPRKDAPVTEAGPNDEDESWRDEGIIDALRRGKPLWRLCR